MHVHFFWSPASVIVRPRHLNTTFEILYCGEGSGTMEVEDQVLHFEQGDVLCIPVGVWHHDYSDVSRTNCVVQIDPQFAPSYSHFRMFHDINGDFENLFWLGFRTQISNAPNRDALCSAVANAMLQLIKSWGYRTQASNPAVERVREAIYSGFTDSAFNIAAEIEKTGFNANYFRRIFKEAVGVSPVQYLTQCRLNYARELLQCELGLSVQEIAHQSGFSDAFYFSRLFRSSFGVSPRAFRKAEQESNV